MLCKYLIELLLFLYSRIWFGFQEEVTSGNKDTVSESFRPYFERLIEILISKGQLPINENVFTSEDKELFRAYRSDILDTMVSNQDKFQSKI